MTRDRQMPRNRKHLYIRTCSKNILDMQIHLGLSSSVIMAFMKTGKIAIKNDRVYVDPEVLVFADTNKVLPMGSREELRWAIDDALYTGPVKYLTSKEIQELVKRGEICE